MSPPVSNLLEGVRNQRLLVDLAKGPTVSREAMLAQIDHILSTWDSNCEDEHRADHVEWAQRGETDTAVPF